MLLLTTKDSGKISYRKVCKYDANGKLSEHDYLNAAAKMYLSCKFNPTGKLIERKTYNANGIATSRHMVLFDNAGSKTEEDDFDENGKLIKQFTFQSGPFVGIGLWIKETKYDADGKSIQITDREFEFYPQ